MAQGPTTRPARDPADAATPERARAAPDTRELDSVLGFWLRLAQQKDLRDFTRALSSSGLSQLLYAIMLVVAANPGCRQADLGAALRIRQPNLVEPIDTLVERGLVRREPDPRDRRAQTLRLTDAGQAAAARLRASHDELIAGYRARLGEEGYGRLVELLRLFVEGADGPAGLDRLY